MHVHSVVPLDVAERVAYLPARPLDTITLEAQIIPPDELKRLRASRNAGKYYTHESYQKAVDWLAAAQAHWGSFSKGSGPTRGSSSNGMQARSRHNGAGEADAVGG
jgi:hypothetical protein